MNKLKSLLSSIVIIKHKRPDWDPLRVLEYEVIHLKKLRCNMVADSRMFNLNHEIRMIDIMLSCINIILGYDEIDDSQLESRVNARNGYRFGTLYDDLSRYKKYNDWKMSGVISSMYSTYLAALDELRVEKAWNIYNMLHRRLRELDY